MTNPDEDSIVTDRSGITENRHLVHAAVVDSAGNLLFSAGNPHRMTLARSAAKPIQALACLETGGPAKFNFDDGDVAMMCGSHNSEDVHIARVRSMLAKVGAEETDLRCGPHPPLSEDVKMAWAKAGREPMAVASNCSGKHAGMLAAAQTLDAGLEGYHLVEHPVQQRVIQATADLCGDDVRWALDGCNAPSPACPLDKLARAFAAIAQAGDDVVDAEKKGIEVPARTTHLARMYSAMADYPEFIGGQGRFCTVLMKAFKGALIGKAGADGCYAIGVPESDETRRLDAVGALGLSVKIEDGNMEITHAATMEVLEQLKIGTPEMRQGLDSFHHARKYNTKGIETGSAAMHFVLRSHKASET